MSDAALINRNLWGTTAAEPKIRAKTVKYSLFFPFNLPLLRRPFFSLREPFLEWIEREASAKSHVCERIPVRAIKGLPPRRAFGGP